VKSSKSAILVGLVVAVLAVSALLLMNNDDSSENQKTENTQTQQTTEKTESEEQTSDIVELASGTDSLSTLVTAVKAADLVSTLQGEGPFTVLAPTNDAFAALPAGTLDDLLKPENKDQLAAVLTYHVVAGKVLSSDLKDGQEVATVQGTKLTVEIMDGKVYFIDAKGNKSMVEKADIEASNGVVHVISSVLLP
jgi:uncharacterized surface protein with fasciclin (FAS1) repeats